MNFTIIGSGFIMPRHAEAINAIGGKIIEIVNTSVGRWKRAIERADVDCVVILTPNDLHYEMTDYAARLGKTVICEKPLTIDSKHCEELTKYPNIYSTLQLRHHEMVKSLKAKIDQEIYYTVLMDIGVHRDQKYYESWKGDKKRSGGILFNLGIHYFDLIQYLFGLPKTYQVDYLNDIRGQGVLSGNNYICHWKITTDESKENQHRIFTINGEPYNFSVKDNLSYENLHRFVYEDVLQGKGVAPQEELKSIRIIEKLYQTYN